MIIKQGKREISLETLNRLISDFSKFKAENDKKLEDDDVFIKTPAFKELSARQAERSNTVVLGRKGDGKTAILRKLAHEIKSNGKEPNGERSIELFEQIDVEDSYFTELINQFGSIIESIHKVYPRIYPDQIAKKIWTKYLLLISLRITCQNAIEIAKENGSKEELINFLSLSKAIKLELNSSQPEFSSSEASQGFLNYLKSFVKSMSMSDDAMAGRLLDMQKKDFDPMAVMHELPKEIYEGADLIKSSKIHLTLALDRFDDFVDRLASADISKTSQLRRHFLHGLVSSLYHIQRIDSFSWLRLIALLPDDLVVDLELRETAAVQRMLFVRISWPIQYLQEMIDSRISSVIPNTELDDLFPFLISNSNKKVQRKESPFDYIVRHTTRRPREIMAHLCNIFIKIRDSWKSIDSKQMNIVVASTNQEIVDTQIVREWASVLPTLRNIIDRLHRSEFKTVFGYDELIYSGIWQYFVQLGSNEETEMDEEIKTFLLLSTLFRLGMIGFRVSRATMKDGFIRQGENDFVRYIFCYSKSIDPIRDVCSFLLDPKIRENADEDQGKAVRGLLLAGRHASYEITLCFSPMFFESLDADHDFSFLIDEIEAEDGK